MPQALPAPAAPDQADQPRVVTVAGRRPAWVDFALSGLAFGAVLLLLLGLRARAAAPAGANLLRLIGDAVYGLDLWVVQLINGLAGVSTPLDALMVRLNDDLVYTLPIALSLIWLWFGGQRWLSEREGRQRLVYALVAMGVALVLARALVHFYARERPFAAGDAKLLAECLANSCYPDKSSFPSDHATLAFIWALAFPARGRWRALLLVVATLMALPRLYIGGHYLSDMAAGFLLAVGVALALRHATGSIVRLGAPILGWADRAPRFFYPLAFLLVYEMVLMFADVRGLAGAVLKLVQRG